MVRPDEVDPDDDAWTEGIDRWRRNAGAIAGNDIEVIEDGLTAAVEKLSHGGHVWEEITRDGVAVFGASLHELQETADAVRGCLAATDRSERIASPVGGSW